MSAVNNNQKALQSAALQTSSLTRYIPQPKSNLGSVFSRVLSTAGSVVSGGVGAFSGMDSQYQSLIQEQMRVQQQMQLVTMHSNTEKSRHESKMAALRNLRAA